MLLDRRASSVWKEAFKRCSDVLPSCPMDISEPRWASMLFGPATCDVGCFTVVFKNADCCDSIAGGRAP